MDELERMWRAHGLDEFDVVWKRACRHAGAGEAPEGTPTGTVQLSYVVRVHSSATSGGLAVATGENERFRFERAAEAFHYFGLTELAVLFTDILDHDLDDAYAESRQADFLGLLGPMDRNVREAYRAKATRYPADFGLE